jgi:quinol monooxygenase YgiN
MLRPTAPARDAAMVIYEVNLAVDAEIAGAYAAWLGPHIEAILALDGFLGAAWFEVEGDAANGRVRWCVQYRLRDRAALQRYFDEHAARFRAEGAERFGGRFEASRRVLALRETVAPRGHG